jgi:hypothetical protein
MPTSPARLEPATCAMYLSAFFVVSVLPAPLSWGRGMILVLSEGYHKWMGIFLSVKTA